ncbi:MAG: TauD/TfdA family dioxygenase, partial [Myxococcota bacterium]|nr:TauD/TfdA family dioxygenase [Myxococcota bacterium]
GIFFHHEMAQTPLYPRWILFFCEVAAEEGGASPICRSDVLYEKLASDRPQFIRDCEKKGLRYSHVMPAENDAQSGLGRSWRETLAVQSKSEAESRLAALGYEWAWEKDDCLRTTSPPLPAIKRLGPARKSFFNQLIAAYKGWQDERNDPSSAIRHGDDSALDAEAVRYAIDVADGLAFDIPWQPGDFAIVDNRVVMHARGPFKGTRRVFASLAGMERQSFSITQA